MITFKIQRLDDMSEHNVSQLKLFRKSLYTTGTADEILIKNTLDDEFKKETDHMYVNAFSDNDLIGNMKVTKIAVKMGKKWLKSRVF